MLKDYENERKLAFRKLVREHGNDVIDVTPDEILLEKNWESLLCDDKWNSFYSLEMEGYFMAVMLLKSLNDFDSKKKIRNVRIYGGGYYEDGTCYGLSFHYKGIKYEFRTVRPDNLKTPESKFTNMIVNFGVYQIPVNEKTKEILKEFGKAGGSHFASYTFSKKDKKR